MMKEAEKCYFQGKYFDNSEDMFKWAKEWANLPLNQQTAEDLFKVLGKDVIMNIHIYEMQFTNREFQFFLEKMFQMIMRHLNKRREIQ